MGATAGDASAIVITHVRQAPRSVWPGATFNGRETATVSRQRKRRPSHRTRRREPAVEQAHPIWVDVSGRRMFVVGFTSAGTPYGIFEDEIDVDADGPDMTGSDQPF